MQKNKSRRVEKSRPECPLLLVHTVLDAMQSTSPKISCHRTVFVQESQLLERETKRNTKNAKQTPLQTQE
jgi:hypothetical protein